MNPPIETLINHKTRQQAQADGFATYNNCPHLCLDIPDGMTTITCKLSNGQQVTLSFLPYAEEPQPKCMDVVVHKTPTTPDGVPKQRVMALGQGPTNFVSRYDDEQPTTVTTVLIDNPTDT